MTHSSLTIFVSVAVLALAGVALVSLARFRRILRRTATVAASILASIILFLAVGNLLLSTTPGVPHRPLDPGSSICQDGFETGWDILAPTDRAYVANDEWAAIDTRGGDWRARLSCSIQRHRLADPSSPTAPPFAYDLAFVELQEDGKPYALRTPCAVASPACVDEGYGLVARSGRYQLDALLDDLCQRGADGKCSSAPHYVMAFIHGWRHDASIGDSNVGEFRHYAAQAANYVRQRAALDPTAPVPRVTAIYIGWRGARTNEIGLQRALHNVGAWIGQALAVFTLFDRKPVSEAVAPSALTTLRAIEQTLGLPQAPPPHAAPPRGANRLIVFGHSLGGNMLATALRDDLVKAVERRKPGEYMPPPVGDLVVLINPASEATKWTDVQKAVWNRIAVSASERQPAQDYIDSHTFFRTDQRPVVVSATAARDWPPGGRRELDCGALIAQKDARTRADESARLAAKGVAYDWATYDLFPAFKLDFRPVADTLQRSLSGVDPHDACAALRGEIPGWWATSVGYAADLLRFAPYQSTDPEQTRTIGNYDPPRAARGRTNNDYVSGRPFGTTHELRGRDGGPARKLSTGQAPREIPVDYDEIGSPLTSCPASNGWLAAARAQRLVDDPKGHGTFWVSSDAGANQPALLFRHGFWQAGLSPITRANDPFWNMRAFDTALARHDGYMLSSFICALNQLVLDDPVAFPVASPVAQTVAPTKTAPAQAE